MRNHRTLSICQSLSHIEVVTDSRRPPARNPMQSQLPDGALVLQSGVPPMLWCSGAGSWYSGVVGSVRTRKGSSSERLAQETSAITTTESAETTIIDFFMAGTVVEAAGQFNRRTA